MESQLWTLCAATFKNLIWTLDEVNRFSRTMMGVAPSAHHRRLLRPLGFAREKHRGFEACDGRQRSVTSRPMTFLANLVTLWTRHVWGSEENGVTVWRKTQTQPSNNRLRVDVL